MLYWLLYEQLYRYFSPLRVFRFITFRTAFASITSLFLCLVLGPWLIAKLRQFQIGQVIREEGPRSHQKKAGTPTMGGVLIVISIVVPTLLWANLTNAYVWIALFSILAFGAITPRSASTRTSASPGGASSRRSAWWLWRWAGFCWHCERTGATRRR
jgi:phospho-N-acetylmuramoyl-pentapeptide-transferase